MSRRLRWHLLIGHLLTHQKVADAYQKFIERGVSHLNIVNAAATVSVSAAVDSYREQFKLFRLLRRLQPGNREWSSSQPA
jgi:hypothetical protein